MSRSGYSYELDNWDLIRWRGAVASAFNGKRGQAFLREMLAALDAMPAKRLIRTELVKDGEVCAMGAVCVRRGLDVSDHDPYEYETVAATMGVAEAMVREIAEENDHEFVWENNRRRDETPEERWTRMRTWIAKEIKP